MPQYQIQAPNGLTYQIEGPAGASQADVIQAVLAQHPDAANPIQKTGGVLGALGSSTESDIGNIGTGIGALLGSPEEAVKKNIARQEALGQKYDVGDSWEKIKAAYNAPNGGFLSALGTAAKEVPVAAAGMVEPIAKLEGPAAIGAGLGTMVEPGLGTAVGAGIGQGVGIGLDYLSRLGSSATEQAQQQQAAGQPVNVNMGRAALYAVPETALDTALPGVLGKNATIMGRKMVGSVFGPAVDNLLNRGLTAEAEKVATAKLANEGFWQTLGRGTLHGAAVGTPIMVAQTALERAQAGQDLFSDDAMHQYGSAAASGVLAAPLGAYGAFQNRGQAREQVRANSALEAKQKADAEEAAKNTPEALTKLDNDYSAAKQQLDNLDEQVKALQPKKGATEEDRKAFQTLKKQRDDFDNNTFKPLVQEYTKRKDAIGQMYETKQTAAETEAAPTQETAAAPIPAQEPKHDVHQLMREHDTLRNQLGQIETQLGQAKPEDFDAINAQRQELQKRLDARAALIEEQGGTPLTAPEFEQATAAKMQALNTQHDKAQKGYTDALANKDYDTAAKFKDALLALQKQRDELGAQTARNLKALKEKEEGLTKKGQTRDLFEQLPQQPETEEGLKYENIEGEPVATPGTAQEMAQVFALPKGTLRDYQASKAAEKVDAAHDELASAVDSGDQERIDNALKAVNKHEAEQARLEKPFQKNQTLDLFDPSNTIRTAINNGDLETAEKYSTEHEAPKAEDLKAQPEERDKLINVLDDRLGLTGSQRTQRGFGEIAQALAALFPNEKSTHWSRKLVNNEGLLRSGTFPDAKVQAAYDASPEAYAHDFVMNAVENLRKTISKRQGNEKASKLEKLVHLENELEALKARLKSGVALPTEREKVARLNAKLGKGPEVPVRQMNDKERSNLNRRIKTIEKDIEALKKKIKPVENAMLRVYSTLFEKKELKTVKETQAAKERLSAAPAEAARNKLIAAVEKYKTAQAFGDEEAIKAARKEMRQASTLSREAKRAKRINEGDVAYEASKSEKMDALAYGLGTHTEEFQNALQEAHDRLQKLIKRYGEDDEQVKQYKADTKEVLVEQAIKAGRKTEEYKAAKQEQMKSFKEALAQGTQETPSKRTGAQTRTVSQAAREERTGSPESRAATQARQESAANRSMPSQVRAAMKGVFRTATKPGASLKENTVAKLADRIMEGWKRIPKTEVVADEKGLPEAIYKQAEAEGKIGQIPGVFDPNTETVYLVASNLKDGNDVAMTLAHEVAGHYGLRSMLGDDYSKIMQRVYNGNEAVREKAKEKMAGNSALSQDIATEEVLAEMAEKGPLQNDSRIKHALRTIYGAIKQWFAQKLGITHVSDKEVEQVVANARRFVQEGVGEGGLIQKGQYVFQTKPQYANEEMRGVGDIVDKFVAKQKPINERVRAAAGGWLGFATQYIDRFAPLERAARLMDHLKGMQMMYYARMYDQKMHFVSQAVERGAPQIVEKVRKDGSVERIVEARNGSSIKDVVNTLKEATPHIGNGEAVNRIFTAYMAAIRAKSKGFSALHFGDELKESELNKVYDTVNANPELKDVFDRARKQYNDYNRDMIDFLAQTGAISKKTATALMANNDYIPWYRERGGVAEMVIGNENPIRIGNIDSQPYLKELVGGDKPILDFLTTSVQNTNLLADMGLRNMATKNAVYELRDIGMAKMVKAAKGPNIVQFKEHGEDKYAMIEGSPEIPGDLIVKGMQGIPTQMPALWRAMSIPSRLLRKAVTLSPVYMAKQLFRDSLAAPIMSGADFVPVIDALKEIGSPAKETLERRGIVGGQQFTGTTEDITKILRDLNSDKKFFASKLARVEAMGMEADALTRRAQYNSYIKQGLSEMEATLMSLESMNFNKRGASPSIHIANALVPFLNAQIQSLNVLHKAFTGKMPFNEHLKIQEKLLQRGAMVAATSLAYAALMQDDEAYKNANPDEKYGNWFVRVPGVDEPVRIPVPFELGYIFKALPEAVYNNMLSEHGDDDAVKAFKQILLQTIPGGSSYGIPQAIRPAAEAALGKSFYTGRDILSRHEQTLLPEEQFRDNTAEISKMIGKTAGVSPIMLEHLVQGYTGTLGLAFMHAISMPFSPTGPEAAVKRLSDMPVFGSAFQPNDAGGVINSVYENMLDAKKVEDTYKEMLSQGRQAEANELLQRRGDDFANAQMSDWFTSHMNNISKAERAVRASDMSPQEKRKMLDDLRQTKIQVANAVKQASGKTTPQ